MNIKIENKLLQIGGGLIPPNFIRIPFNNNLSDNNIKILSKYINIFIDEYNIYPVVFELKTLNY